MTKYEFLQCVSEYLDRNPDVSADVLMVCAKHVGHTQAAVFAAAVADREIQRANADARKYDLAMRAALSLVQTKRMTPDILENLEATIMDAIHLPNMCELERKAVEWVANRKMKETNQ